MMISKEQAAKLVADRAEILENLRALEGANYAKGVDATSQLFLALVSAQSGGAPNSYLNILKKCIVGAEVAMVRMLFPDRTEEQYGDLTEKFQTEAINLTDRIIDVAKQHGVL